ncbi:hypothetical protein LINPERHAP2_LOCUS32599 [Linum perenne]
MALVVKVLERSFSFLTVKRRLEILWARAGIIQVSDATNDFFVVRFSDPEDYQRAAFGGPWKIYDFYISVARWTPDFNEEDPIKTVLTWVRLPKLPVHYFNNLAVTRIGNHIGRTVRLDLATQEGARARYARVCVEVDFSKPLLGKYMIENRIFYVEYESLENICCSCGTYGHTMDACPERAPQPTADPTEQAIPEPSPDKTEGDTGSWMIIQRRKGKKLAVASPSSLKPESGSRFSVLHGDAEPETSIPQPVNIPEKQSEADPDAVVLAAKLAEVLAKAMSREKVSSTPKEAKKTPSGKTSDNRKPLADVSNTVKTKKTTKKLPKQASDLTDSDKAASLFSVPVTYSNPVFQETALQSTVQKTHKKTGKRGAPTLSGRRTDSSLNTKKKADRQVRTFTSRPPESTADFGEKVDKPPDST